MRACTRGRRAFTLIECMIVLAIITIAFFPVMMMGDRLTSAYQRSIRDIDERTETQGLSSRVETILQNQPDYKIDSDNKGAKWSGGSLRWEGESLRLALGEQQQNLGKNVTQFSLHRRDGRTYLTLVRLDSGRTHPQRILTELGAGDD